MRARILSTSSSDFPFAGYSSSSFPFAMIFFNSSMRCNSSGSYGSGSGSEERRRAEDLEAELLEDDALDLGGRAMFERVGGHDADGRAIYRACVNVKQRRPSPGAEELRGLRNLYPIDGRRTLVSSLWQSRKSSHQGEAAAAPVEDILEVRFSCLDSPSTAAQPRGAPSTRIRLPFHLLTESTGSRTSGGRTSTAAGGMTRRSSSFKNQRRMDVDCSTAAADVGIRNTCTRYDIITDQINLESRFCLAVSLDPVSNFLRP